MISGTLSNAILGQRHCCSDGVMSGIPEVARFGSTSEASLAAKRDGAAGLSRSQPVNLHHHHKHPRPLAMFSPALGRAFRSPSAITAVPSSAVGRAAISTAQQPFRPSHQRRLSSSKPSTPPDNSKRPTENAAEELKTSEKRSRRSSKLKASSASAPATAARNIPYVKPTDHLMEHRTLSKKLLLC